VTSGCFPQTLTGLDTNASGRHRPDLANTIKTVMTTQPGDYVEYDSGGKVNELITALARSAA